MRRLERIDSSELTIPIPLLWPGHVFVPGPSGLSKGPARVRECQGKIWQMRIEGPTLAQRHATVFSGLLSLCGGAGEGEVVDLDFEDVRRQILSKAGRASDEDMWRVLDDLQQSRLTMTSLASVYAAEAVGLGLVEVVDRASGRVQCRVTPALLHLCDAGLVRVNRRLHALLGRSPVACWAHWFEGRYQRPPVGKELALTYGGRNFNEHGSRRRLQLALERIESMRGELAKKVGKAKRRPRLAPGVRMLADGSIVTKVDERTTRIEHPDGVVRTIQILDPKPARAAELRADGRLEVRDGVPSERDRRGSEHHAAVACVGVFAEGTLPLGYGVLLPAAWALSEACSTASSSSGATLEGSRSAAEATTSAAVARVARGTRKRSADASEAQGATGWVPRVIEGGKSVRTAKRRGPSLSGFGGLDES